MPASIADFADANRTDSPDTDIRPRSGCNRPAKMHNKMLEWIASGAELAWMIDPRTRLVTIYRRGQDPEQRAGVTELAGEGPVAGFVLPMDPVWNPTR